VCSGGGVVAPRGRSEALRVLVDAVRVLEKFMRGLVQALRVLEKTKTVLVESTKRY
jgi:hypothetical protein